MSHFHIYSLPIELLDTFTPRNLVSNVPRPRSPSPPPVASASTVGSRACNVCNGVAFADVEEQRAHFRSDWHRYNVKTRLNGGQSVSELEFSKLVDGLEDSISGSASEDSDSDDSDDAVDALVNKATRKARSRSPSQGPALPAQTALAWFHSPPSTQLGVYRAVFNSGVHQSDYLSELKRMQTGGRTWAMFMVAGGHFAGAIVRVSRGQEDDSEEVHTKKKPKKPKADTEVLRHKTFHRYTTRRKQGGSQSLNDNAKGNAKSAGAQLRRYGEQALRDDIRNLIHEWAEEINACERIWIRASGSNRKIFMDYDGCVIEKTDGRLRTFPFPTRRPTQSELARCLLELTRAKTSHLTEDALRAQDEAYLASLPKPKVIPVAPAPSAPEKPKPVKLSKEEEIFREKWSRLLEMVSKGRLEPLKSFWDREGENLGGVDAHIPDWTGEKRATLLQVAAHAGHEDVTSWLLETHHADPTVDVPLKGGEQEEDSDSGEASDSPKPPKGSRRTAYDLARTRPVRDVFRRCAGAHPDWWDWFGAARVPSALSKEQEEEREEKKKVRRKGLKDKVKEREAKAKPAAEPEPEPEPAKPAPLRSSTGPQRLGGASGAAAGITGLTPEMRAKVERERRARAAEARLKVMSQ
ncbi:bVLRF1 domain-containing protein [Mycena sanguinolenta]|uniref:BVLRF1 domain-containing protein n=1 Tax=Mycena sanguinolenta TaxID=230812 RepID=A0A8H6Z7X6_9AGAR|nr:bVLRF1 domain-containing protein [Mycena sanguinolenta]